jgi:hypothetical protein
MAIRPRGILWIPRGLGPSLKGIRKAYPLGLVPEIASHSGWRFLANSPVTLNSIKVRGVPHLNTFHQEAGQDALLGWGDVTPQGRI